MATALFVVGITVSVIAAGWHIRRRGLDPFRGASVRRARLSPALVIAPVGVYVLAYLLLEPLEKWLSAGETVRSAQQLRNTSAQLAGAAACLWVGRSAFRHGLRGFLIGRDSPARTATRAVGYFIAVSALCEITYWATAGIVRLFRPEYEFFDHRVIQALRGPTQPAWGPAVLWIGAAVIAPVAEEGFFRGLVQTFLLSASRRRALAIGGTAIFFAVAHADQPHVLPAMTVFGLIIGLQYERSGALLGPIITHGLFNLKTLAFEWWTRGSAV